MNPDTLKKYNIILIILVILLKPGFGQDQFVVTGKIVGENNSPVSDVSISVEGLDIQPVITDQEGKFSLRLSSGEVWLIVNPLSEYKSKRIFLNNRSDLLINLTGADMISDFDDVQLLFNTEKRRDIISAVKKVDLSRAEHNNYLTVDQLFQGTVPGMYTVNLSGSPGSGATSYIRGIGSMNTTNAPLVIVDGMPFESPGLFTSELDGNAYNPLSTINPSDVSSITVLKDPVLTTLFGTNAANGVVLIETLKASATKTTINFALKTGLSLPPSRFIPQLNAEQYKLLSNELLVSSPINVENIRTRYPGLYVTEGDDDYYRYMHNTNWQDYIFSQALLNSAYISIKGGSEIATYGLSVGYQNHEGIVRNTNYNRYNVGFVSDLTVFSWLRINVNANLTNSNSQLRESGVAAQNSPITTSLFKPPIMYPYRYDDEGQELFALDDIDELGTSNPLAVINNFVGENKNYRFTSSVKGEADITDGLTFQTMIGINFNTLKEFVFMPNRGMERYYDGEAHSVSLATNNYLYSLFNNNFFNYKRQFAVFHDFSSSTGLRVQKNMHESDIGEALNLPDNDQYSNLQSGVDDLKNIKGSNNQWNWLTAYQYFNYKYKDKYLLSAALSGDFSTRTGPEAESAIKINGHPFGLFYSIGGGWRISDEPFLRNLKNLDNLLLRSSYGTAGNNDIGNFSALNYYSLSLYRETSGLIPSVIANKSLQYEKTSHINLGMDVSLKGDRIALSVNYFIRTTDNMLIYEPLSSYLGYGYRPANNGVVENKGWEFSFFHRIIDFENFKWDIRSDLSTLKNQVIDLGGSELVTQFVGGQFITREGEAINSFFGFQFDGVYATQQEAEAENLLNDKLIPYGAGDARYLDISGPDNEPDGIIDEYDKANLGSPVPDYFGSISNRFIYKRWSVDILFQFVYGNEVFNYTRYLNERMVDLSNQSKKVLNRWQFEGDETDVPRALWNDPVGNSAFSSRWIEDGSYLRLKTLTFRYSIPNRFLYFQNADFFITVNNMFTVASYLGYDPEFSYSFRPMQQGIDYSQIPQHRQFVVGMRVGL